MSKLAIGDLVRVASRAHRVDLDWPAELVGEQGRVVEDGEDIDGADAEPGVWRVLIDGQGWYIHEGDLDRIAGELAS